MAKDMDIKRETPGLQADLLGDFFLSLMDLIEQIDSAAAVYRHYTTYCLSRDVEPASLSVFTRRFHAVLHRIKRELL